MKKQEKTAMAELDSKELEVQLKETEEKIFKLRFSISLAQTKNPLEIRNLKRHRARLLTWIRQKQGAA